MSLLDVNLWALWLAFGLMLVAAAVNLPTLRVPNWLSLSSILAGWLIALAVSAGAGVPSKGGGIVPSLALTAFGIFVFSIGSIGAGCVKMQMAFGAWVGCALPLQPACIVMVSGTLVGKVATVLTVQYWKRRIKDEQNDPSPRLFPAQVTLSLGTIVGSIVPFVAGWV